MLFWFWMVCSFCIKAYGLEEIPLQEWTKPRFVECGIPPNVTPEKKPSFLFNPTDPVIADDLRDEGNLYFTLESLNDTSFRFYGEKHPEFPNYKLYLRENGLIAEFCQTSTLCKELSHCEKGVRNDENFDKNNDNKVYISWKKEEDAVSILVQIHGSLIKCSLLNSILKIQKLVMNSNTKQRVLTSEYVYNTYTKNNVVNLTTTNFNLDKFILMNIFQCYSCEVVFALKCDNFYDNTTVKGLNGFHTIFGNSKVLHGWASVTLPSKHNISDLKSCTLEMVPSQEQSNARLDPFWILAKPSTVDKQLIEVPATKTTTTTTTPQPVATSKVHPTQGKGWSDSGAETSTLKCNNKSKSDELLRIINETVTERAKDGGSSQVLIVLMTFTITENVIIIVLLSVILIKRYRNKVERAEGSQGEGRSSSTDTPDDKNK